MEEVIKKARQEIVGSIKETEVEKTPLTQCACDIAEIAITSLTGELREKALNISKAIVDYERCAKTY